MDLHGSDLGFLGFSCTDIYESVSMCYKDAICLRKILLKMALDTVYCTYQLTLNPPPPLPRFLIVSQHKINNERISK